MFLDLVSDITLKWIRWLHRKQVASCYLSLSGFLLGRNPAFGLCLLLSFFGWGAGGMLNKAFLNIIFVVVDRCFFFCC